MDPPLLTRAPRDDASAPLRRPLTAAEIRAEQLEAVAFDRNRRDAELAELRAAMEAMRHEVDGLRQRLDEHPPRRAAPPADHNAFAHPVSSDED